MIDGDDLAFDYMAYKRYLKKFNTNKNLQVFKFPENIVTGTFTYIFASNALKLMYAKSSKLKKIDVIEFFLKYLKNIEEIRLPKILLDKKIRLTLDYKEDLKFFIALFKKVKITEKTSNIVKFLEKDDNIKNLNYHLEEFWRKNQQ